MENLNENLNDNLNDDFSDHLNEGLNETKRQASGCLHRFSKSIKVVVIAFLVLLLLIPMFMIEDMISERGRTQTDAIAEVGQKWSLAQTITGPYINLKYPITHEDNGVKKVSMGDVTLLPDELSVDGQLHTEILRRGIYKVNVYQSELVIKGFFSSEELLKNNVDMDALLYNRAAVCLNLTDMRGLSEQVSITLNDSVYMFEPGMDGRGIDNMGVHAIVDLSALKEGKKLPYEMKIKLKGSQSINFTPLGKTTKVNLKANWNTPSFDGNYLPEKREITETDFSAQWQVLNLNRNYPQVLVNYQNASIKDIQNSNFGVNLKMPVEQYQQSMRSTKYAILVILLTFMVIFFTEILEKTRIHALQYLLVGLALCLFYSLLLSMSEHIGFGMAYLVASALTIALVGGYMLGIIRRKKPAFIMVGLLGVLYIYVFILIQLETFALLAGSLGLFVILAMVMYFSKKIDWFNE
ncbi:cell envelope integrity protein CreD [Bacteroides stercorirosoris]|jgi:inner membrane protein|uniref:Inner membrane protein n=1 Tax=Bacteroides stercorirosoris TaxID=871324 RepID=A0A1M6HPR1_9BACE|nr:cell envelope integrity protein CreD [Bacteroides stercorirosoris]SHJ24103.1 inner membrane protein [Bacteroides stercorirosoris]